MKIYQVEFEPMWPVPSGLIIIANNIDEARGLAEKTIEHVKDLEIKEIELTGKAQVLFYESGDY